MHRARKNKWSESPDIPDTFKVKAIVKKHFNLIFLTEEVVKIPVGGYVNYRKPDLYNKERQIALELDGVGVHGFGDLLREKDIRQNEDFSRAGVQVVRLNSAQTNGYEEDKIVEQLRVIQPFKSLILD